MIIYTIGFTKRTAEEFFYPIKEEKIELMIDIRLNNKSQLAGFTKGQDLAYFLKEICGCAYDHNQLLSPTKEILDGYKSGDITWAEYEALFLPLMEQRQIGALFAEEYNRYYKVCLLCSEPEPTRCHRRLVAEFLKKLNPMWDILHI